MVAFTNHALDHLLESVLKAGITENVVRLGSRSQSERLQALTLDKLESAQASFMRRGFNSAYAAMKRAEEGLTRALHEFIETKSGADDDLERYLQLEHYEQYEFLSSPSDEIRGILSKSAKDGAVRFIDIYQLWEKGRDIKGRSTRRPRPLTILLQTSNVWSMSLMERKQLSQKWRTHVEESEHDMKMHTYESQKRAYQEAKERVEEYQMMVGCPHPHSCECSTAPVATT